MPINRHEPRILGLNCPNCFGIMERTLLPEGQGEHELGRCEDCWLLWDITRLREALEMGRRASTAVKRD